jgi:hypothetical protein
MRSDGLHGEIRRGRGGKIGAKIGGDALMFSKPCARIRRRLWARDQLIFDMRSPVKMIAAGLRKGFGGSKSSVSSRAI